jgi:hypothetical protein
VEEMVVKSGRCGEVGCVLVSTVGLLV